MENVKILNTIKVCQFKYNSFELLIINPYFFSCIESQSLLRGLRQAFSPSPMLAELYLIHLLSSP